MPGLRRVLVTASLMGLAGLVVVALGAEALAPPSNDPTPLATWIRGARATLWTAGSVLGLALAVGIPAGAFAAAAGPLAEGLLARTGELAGLLPSVLLVAVVQATHLVPERIGLVAVLAALRAVATARLVRSLALSIGTAEFVVAARALGLSPAQTFRRHVLPALLGPVLASAVAAAAAVVSTEAALAYLGLGSPASDPSWGAQVGRSLAPLPLASIALTIGALAVIAEALDRRSDPRACHLDRPGAGARNRTSRPSSARSNFPA